MAYSYVQPMAYIYVQPMANIRLWPMAGSGLWQVTFHRFLPAPGSQAMAKALLEGGI
jgi:hypothetical protein